MNHTLLDLLNIERDDALPENAEIYLDAAVAEPVEQLRAGVTYAYLVDGPRGQEVHNHVMITE